MNDILKNKTSGSLKERQADSLQKKKKAKRMKKYKKIMVEGIITKNPILVQLLGTCATLAITTSIANGLGMGIAVIFVLIFSNFFISLLRNFIPSKIRIASYVVIISGFVSIVEMVLKAYLPALSNSLGVFIPLIVVNCIILARAEAYASKNDVLHSAVDGIGMGLGFTLSITLIGIIRELFGAGTIFGVQVLGTGFEPMLLLVLAPGGFIVYGLLLGIINAISARSSSKKSKEVKTA